METVRLPNGKEEAKVLVATVLISIKHLLKDDPMAFYDFVMMCRQDDYKPDTIALEKIRSLGLIEGTGRPHDSIINIVDAAVKGDGLAMSIEPLSN